jgi:WD40 repeat protein
VADHIERRQQSVRLGYFLGHSVEPLIDLREHEDGVFKVAISRNNQWLVTASADGTLRLRDLSKDGIASPLRLSLEPVRKKSVAMSGYGRWLYFFDGSENLWNLAASEPVMTPLNAPPYELDTKALFSHPEPPVDDIRLWSLNAEDPSASPIVMPEHSRPVRTVEISRDGRWLIIGCGDERALIWDLTRPALAKEPLVLQDSAPIETARFSDDGHWLITGGWESGLLISQKNVRVWDMTAEDVQKIPSYS